MNNREPELRDEYDFASGIRGKYANRFAAGIRVREVGTPDAVAKSDASQRITQTLAASQELEFFLAVFLVASTRWEAPAAVSSLRNALHHSSLSSWESLLARSVVGELHKNLAHQLDSFAKSKEWLVHSCLVWMDFEARLVRPDFESTFERLEDLQETTAFVRSAVDEMMQTHVYRRLSREELLGIEKAVADAWIDVSK